MEPCPPGSRQALLRPYLRTDVGTLGLLFQIYILTLSHIDTSLTLSDIDTSLTLSDIDTSLTLSDIDTSLTLSDIDTIVLLFQI